MGKLGSGDWKLSAAVFNPIETANTSEQEGNCHSKFKFVIIPREPACHSRLAQVKAAGNISKEFVMVNPEC